LTTSRLEAFYFILSFSFGPWMNTDIYWECYNYQEINAVANNLNKETIFWPQLSEGPRKCHFWMFASYLRVNARATSHDDQKSRVCWFPPIKKLGIQTCWPFILGSPIQRLLWTLKKSLSQPIFAFTKTTSLQWTNVTFLLHLYPSYSLFGDENIHFDCFSKAILNSFLMFFYILLEKIDTWVKLHGKFQKLNGSM